VIVLSILDAITGIAFVADLLDWMAHTRAGNVVTVVLVVGIGILVAWSLGYVAAAVVACLFVAGLAVFLTRDRRASEARQARWEKRQRERASRHEAK